MPILLTSQQGVASLFSCESTITSTDESVGIYPPTHEVPKVQNKVASISNYIRSDVTLPSASWTLCYWWKFERFNHNEDILFSMATQGIVHNNNVICLGKPHNFFVISGKFVCGNIYKTLSNHGIATHQGV